MEYRERLEHVSFRGYLCKLCCPDHHLARNVLAQTARVHAAGDRHYPRDDAGSVATHVAPDGRTPPRHMARSAPTAEGLP